MKQICLNMVRLLPSFAFVAMTYFLGGCAAIPNQHSIANWHNAVVAVRDQSIVTFQGVNTLTREAQIKRAAQLEQLKE